MARPGPQKQGHGGHELSHPTRAFLLLFSVNSFLIHNEATTLLYFRHDLRLFLLLWLCFPPCHHLFLYFINAFPGSAHPPPHPPGGNRSQPLGIHRGPSDRCLPTSITLLQSYCVLVGCFNASPMTGERPGWAPFPDGPMADTDATASPSLTKR